MGVFSIWTSVCMLCGLSRPGGIPYMDQCWYARWFISARGYSLYGPVYACWVVYPGQGVFSIWTSVCMLGGLSRPGGILYMDQCMHAGWFIPARCIPYMDQCMHAGWFIPARGVFSIWTSVGMLCGLSRPWGYSLYGPVLVCSVVGCSLRLARSC